MSGQAYETSVIYGNQSSLRGALEISFETLEIHWCENLREYLETRTEL